MLLRQLRTAPPESSPGALFAEKRAAHAALFVYSTVMLPLLGVVLLNVQNHYNFIESVVYGITGGVGFLLAIVLFASIRERLALVADPPKCFEGFPIALITAGLMALAFGGFSGLQIW